MFNLGVIGAKSTYETEEILNIRASKIHLLKQIGVIFTKTWRSVEGLKNDVIRSHEEITHIYSSLIW